MRRHFAFPLLLLLWSLRAVANDPPLDVTLIVSADPHVLTTAPIAAHNQVRAMDRLRTADGSRLVWPIGLIDTGVPIPRPEAVFVAGDLSYDGLLSWLKPERQLFYKLYIDPKRPELPVRVFPGAGNHDTSMHVAQYLLGFQDVTNYAVNNLIGQSLGDDKRVVRRFDPPLSTGWWHPPHYAVELGLGGRLLVVNLNTSIGEPCRSPVGLSSHGRYLEPNHAQCDAFGWLRETLKRHKEKHGDQAPAILVQHYGYDNWGTKTDDFGYRGYFWAPDYRKALADAISGYRVIALVYGHGHEFAKPEEVKAQTQETFGGDLATSTELGDETGRAFTNFSEKKPEYCRALKISGRDSIRCTSLDSPATVDVTADVGDKGWSAGRGWIDVNGDQRADYCRVTGKHYLSCRLSNGKGFGSDTPAQWIADAGEDPARWWVTLESGKPAFCRVTSSFQLTCNSWNGVFGADFGVKLLDKGWADGRAFVDVNHDGKLDFCRTVGQKGDTHVACNVSSGSAYFTQVIMSGVVDLGYEKGRSWADANGDGRADYCRVLKNDSGIGRLGCILTNKEGTGFETTEMLSPWDGDDKPGFGFDVGFRPGRTWADFNKDGKADYCRVVEAESGDLARIECTLAGGNAYGPSLRSHYMNPGDGADRTFVDVNGDGRADFCRTRASFGSVAACTLAATITTGPPVPSIGVATGLCGNDFNGGFTVLHVTDNELDVVEVVKSDDCDSDEYAGIVSVNRSYSLDTSKRESDPSSALRAPSPLPEGRRATN